MVLLHFAHPKGLNAPASILGPLKLSSKTKQQLKNVNSVDDLLQLIGFPDLLIDQEYTLQKLAAVKESPAFTRTARQRRSQTRKISRQQHGSLAVEANCDVELQSVQLKTLPGAQLFPSCVRLSRCGGCCPKERQCTPVNTTTRHLKVSALPFTLAHLKVSALLHSCALKVSARFTLAPLKDNQNKHHPEQFQSKIRQLLGAKMIKK
nr:uncharacterized protein LOC128691333 [Cherax quadricarinatus]